MMWVVAWSPQIRTEGNKGERGDKRVVLANVGDNAGEAEDGGGGGSGRLGQVSKRFGFPFPTSCG